MPDVKPSSMDPSQSSFTELQNSVASGWIRTLPSLQSPPRVTRPVATVQVIVGVAAASPQPSLSASGHDGTSTPSSMQAALTWRNSAIGVTRSWANGEALGRELGYSRIWAGVHFRNSIEVGHKLGRRIMNDVLATQLVSLPAK